MKKLLSLPFNATKNYYELHDRSEDKWFCTSDPKDKRLGSGSGTTWLLEECCRHDGFESDFESWLSREKRILIHAGGQSRRLPSYAVTGKTGLPLPVFRWARGQRLRQDLISLQLPFFEKIMRQAPESLRTFIASGDVLVRCEEPLSEIPEADVVCFGLWVDASQATRHGVFAARRETPEVLDRMTQKPSLHELEDLSKTHLMLMDIGMWLLSDRAVSLLRERSYSEEEELGFYDLYSDFGLALGTSPKKIDAEINSLSVKVISLNGGEFHHYGTTREMITSTLALQNKVHDQRLIMHRKIKPNPAIFTQNALVGFRFDEFNRNIWVENACIGSEWGVKEDNVITGVPENDWHLNLSPGLCIDMVPIDEHEFAVRPYGIDDMFRGVVDDVQATWMGRPIAVWLRERELDGEVLFGGATDIQSCRLFPCVRDLDEIETVLRWMIGDGLPDEGRRIWMEAERLSAEELMERASIERLYAQRDDFRRRNYRMLEDNYERSVFYQLDLSDVAKEYHQMELPVPKSLPQEADKMQQIHNHMLRSRLLMLNNKSQESDREESAAFSLLRNGMIDALSEKRRLPRLEAYPDQIIWGRSPVRIDFAGGWTDTPPFSLYSGGKVVNIAIELNGQPPLQVYVKPCKEYRIVLRSIDLGATEIVESFDALRSFHQLGSPFSIPKAALALCGFLPEFAVESWNSLGEQLRAFGAGIELTLLAAIPAGSGLGTSSILASTVLGALSDFCGLQWNKQDICVNTLIVEQLLTSGGGWQDQYGGIFHGVKLLETEQGLAQTPQISWLPDFLFTDQSYKNCHLLYYSGITRVAKNILGEIVRGMFLNSAKHLSILDDMKVHADDMTNCIQRGDIDRYGRLILKTWEQKKTIDSGTNPPEVEKMIDMIKDYTLGYTLPGAGGGGYLYMVAKNEDAALRIRKILTEQPLNRQSRFVEMELSRKGFQVSRS